MLLKNPSVVWSNIATYEGLVFYNYILKEENSYSTLFKLSESNTVKQAYSKESGTYKF